MFGIVPINNIQSVLEKQQCKMDEITWCLIYECSECWARWSIVSKELRSTARCERCKIPAEKVLFCKFL